jgi:hypothetical protein
MREASAMVVRHPLFVSVTNVCRFVKGCTYDGNEFGNTSIFGSLRELSRDADFKMILDRGLKNIPDCFKSIDKKELHPSYKALISTISPETEGILVYDLNLRLIRIPSETNAPDQGYPTIKNIRTIKIN